MWRIEEKEHVQDAYLLPLPQQQHGPREQQLGGEVKKSGQVVVVVVVPASPPFGDFQ